MGRNGVARQVTKGRERGGGGCVTGRGLQAADGTLVSPFCFTASLA